MARPNGTISHRDGYSRLWDDDNNVWLDVSEFITSIVPTTPEKPIGETPVLSGTILGEGTVGQSTLDVTMVFTDGNTVGPHGDIYKDFIYPKYKANCGNIPVEWQKKAACASGQPFSVGDDVWYTDPAFSRVVHAEAPKIDRGDSTTTIVKMKISTQDIDEKTL